MGFRLTGPGSRAQLRYQALARDAHAHAATCWANGDPVECDRFLRMAQLLRGRIAAIRTLRAALQINRRRAPGAQA